MTDNALVTIEAIAKLPEPTTVAQIVEHTEMLEAVAPKLNTMVEIEMARERIELLGTLARRRRLHDLKGRLWALELGLRQTQGKLTPPLPRGRGKRGPENIRDANLFSTASPRERSENRALAALPQEVVDEAKREVEQTGRPIGVQTLIARGRKAKQQAERASEPETPRAPPEKTYPDALWIEFDLAWRPVQIHRRAREETQRYVHESTLESAAWAGERQLQEALDRNTELEERVAFLEDRDAPTDEDRERTLNAQRAQIDGLRASLNDCQTHRGDAERALQTARKTIRAHGQANKRARKQIEAATAFIKERGLWPAFEGWLKDKDIDLSDD